jgi:hypothetical protein
MHRSFLVLVAAAVLVLALVGAVADLAQGRRPLLLG